MKIKGVYPIRRWRVPSRSDVGVYYTIELETDGRFYCDCPASVYSKKKNKLCKHIMIVKELIIKNFLKKR